MHRPLLTELGKMSWAVAINRSLLPELKRAATVGSASTFACYATIPLPISCAERVRG